MEALMFGNACNVIGLGLLALIGYVLYRDPRRIGGSAVALGAAALSFSFGNIDKIESLTASASGFNVKTREVQTVINDAKDTIGLLRKLAVATAGLQVKMLAAEGRLQGPASLLGKDAQKEELLRELKSIGLTDEELAKVSAADSPWVKWDYVIAILQPVNYNTDKAEIAAYTKAYNRFTNPLSPEECEEVLNEFHANTEQTKALIDDYTYYLRFGKQRRPEVWSQRPTGLRVAPTATSLR
jgi:hypothetical protein